MATSGFFSTCSFVSPDLINNAIKSSLLIPSLPFSPSNKAVVRILEITSGLYPSLHHKGQWYMPAGIGEVDERFKDKEYPPELAMDSD